MSRVFFKAGKSANQVGIVSGLGTLITWDRLLFQSDANINLANETFTPANLTPLEFDISVFATNLTAATLAELRLLKNGATVIARGIITSVPATSYQFQLQCQDAPASGDFYTASFTGTSVGTITLTADPHTCWFFARQI